MKQNKNKAAISQACEAAFRSVIRKSSASPFLLPNKMS